MASRLANGDDSEHGPTALDATWAAHGVLDWGARHRRDLPWRSCRDRWGVLLSEVVLQQTGVDRGVARWLDAVERWPSPAEFAATPLADVLRWWKGLGYPRRAVNLHRTATIAVERFDGSIPSELPALLALPGIGAYTARAVLAFADDEAVGVVDTNIARLLARRSGRRLTAAVAQHEADEWMGVAAAEFAVGGWEWNQSLMDLGALVCRPAPRCGSCPLSATCRWSTAGRPEPDPARRSAGVSRPQSRFDGSDRQIRGRILGHLDAGPTTIGELAGAVGDERVERLVGDLVSDGLCEIAGELVALAGESAIRSAR